MAKEPTIATGFRIPESLYWEFKRKAVERHVSDTEAVRQAFRDWVNKKPECTTASSPASDY